MTDSAPPTWLGERWSLWQKMGHDGFSVPHEPGLYCFRTLLSNRDAEDRCVIAYIGQTEDLCRRVCQDWGGSPEKTVNPEEISLDANDTKIKIKFFSRWRDYPRQFDVSFCTNSNVLHHNLDDERHRQGAEALAMWSCQIETGRSAVANHERATYALSDYGMRDMGHYRGEILPSMPPRKLHMVPFDPRWMGLNWTRFAYREEIEPHRVSRPDTEMHDASLRRPALYKVADPSTTSILKIGFRESIGKGLRSVLSDLRPAVGRAPVGSWAHLPPDMPRYCYIEVRDALLGAYYYQMGEPPALQFEEVGGSADSEPK